MTLRKPYVDVNGMMLPLPPGDTIATTGGGDSPFINGATQFQFFDDFFLPEASTNSLLNTYELNTIIPGWEINFVGPEASVSVLGDDGTAVGFARLGVGVQESSVVNAASIVRGDRFNAGSFDFEIEMRIDQLCSSHQKVIMAITLDGSSDGVGIFTGGNTLNDQWYLLAGGSSYALGAHNQGTWKKIKITHTRGTPNTLRYYYNNNLIGTITSAYTVSYNDLKASIGTVEDDNAVSRLDIDYISLSFLNMTR